LSTHDHMLNTREAAEFLGVHAETVRRLARKGALPSFKLGADWRFDRDALLSWARGASEISSRPTVLVVDDEKSIRTYLEETLRDEGYRVLSAGDGAEALRLADNVAPDLVILDLLMPGMRGPDVLGEIRRRFDWIPVIIITGYPDSTLMNEALKHSPLTVLAKPVTAERIVLAARQVLGKGL